MVEEGERPGLGLAPSPPRAAEVLADPAAARAREPRTSGPRRQEVPRSREPRTVTLRTTPVFSCPLALNTDFAQRVYRRCWDQLKGDLYVLTVRTRTNRAHETAGAIERIITEAFQKTRQDLASDLERTEVLLDHVKLTDLPVYEGLLSTNATYSTPRAKEFLLLIQQMDQLLMRYDALWLGGFVETQARVDRSQNWQRRMIKICNRLRELAHRTRVSLARAAETAAAKSESVPAGPAAATDQIPGSAPASEGGPAEEVLGADPQVPEDGEGSGPESTEWVGDTTIEAPLSDGGVLDGGSDAPVPEGDTASQEGDGGANGAGLIDIDRAVTVERVATSRRRRRNGEAAGG
jgi:hypothetical protein